VAGALNGLFIADVVLRSLCRARRCISSTKGTSSWYHLTDVVLLGSGSFDSAIDERHPAPSRHLAEPPRPRRGRGKARTPDRRAPHRREQKAGNATAPIDLATLAAPAGLRHPVGAAKSIEGLGAGNQMSAKDVSRTDGRPCPAASRPRDTAATFPEGETLRNWRPQPFMHDFGRTPW